LVSKSFIRLGSHVLTGDPVLAGPTVVITRIIHFKISISHLITIIKIFVKVKIFGHCFLPIKAYQIGYDGHTFLTCFKLRIR